MALIVVLEARDSSHGAEGGSAPGKRQLLCVVNISHPSLLDGSCVLADIWSFFYFCCKDIICYFIKQVKTFQ